jgi:hypothetical protein
MKTVNRIVVIVMLLGVGVVSTLALVKPGFTFSAVEREAQAILRFIRQWPEGEPLWYVRVGVGIVVAAALDLLLLVVIWLEIRRPSSRDIRVTKAEGGQVTLSVASIVDRLQYEIDQIAGVLRSKPRVSGRRGGVVVEANVETASGVDVPQKADEIVQRVRFVVEERMGLKLTREPKVMLRAASQPGRGRRAEAQEAPVPSPPPPWLETEPEADLGSVEEAEVSSSADEGE